MKENIKDIPIVENLPLMVACEEGQHTYLVDECGKCLEETIKQVNFQLQIEADRLKQYGQ